MSIQFKTLNQGLSVTDCPIATLQVKGYNPYNMINVVSFADMIHENSDTYNTTVELTKQSSATYFDIKYYESTQNQSLSFLVTDKATSLMDPLYYQYELMFDTFSVTGSDDIEVYINNEVLLDRSHYSIEYANAPYIDGAPNTNRYESGVSWFVNNSFLKTTTNGYYYRIRLLLPLSLANNTSFYTIRYTKYIDGVTVPNHIELIEPVKLYNTDYNVTDSKIYINTTGSKITQSITKLFIIRDPSTKIKPLGVFDTNNTEFQDSASTSWNLKLSTGGFILNHDNNSNAMYFGLKYVDVSGASAQKQNLQTIKPKIVGANIIKINDHSIYLDETEFKYPMYKLKYYVKNDIPDNINGYLNIDINGNDAGIEVKSIDRTKGYILLNNTLSINDIINISFTIDNTKTMFIRNIELNPKFTETNSEKNNIWKNTSLYNKQIKNLGIAVRHSSSSSTGTIISDYFYPYVFDFDSVTDNNQVKLYKANIVNGSLGTSFDGILMYNPVSGKIMDPTNSDLSDPVSSYFMPICALSINNLTPNNAITNDARKLGGGFGYLEKMHPMNKKSITDIGFFDGVRIPTGNTIIIHIPRSKWLEIYNTFFTSNMFDYDAYNEITINERYMLDESDQKQEVSATEYDDYTNVKKDWAEKQASHYLDQLIKKYISAGTKYILLDESFNPIILRKQ